MLSHTEIECLEKHELTSKIFNGNKTSRRMENKFYLTDQYILLSFDEVLGVEYFKNKYDLFNEFPENPVKLLRKHINPIFSISIAEDSSLICTCSDEAVILWKLDPKLKSWTNETIAVDLGRILSSAVCTNHENIFTSLMTMNEITVIQCIGISDINANGKLILRDIKEFAKLDKNIEQNNWLHNFQFNNTLQIAGLTSGNGVSLQIWEVTLGNIKLKYRSALQMKILAAADFSRRENECYILAISPEGQCETFVVTTKDEFCLLNRIKIEENAPNSTSVLHVEFQIFSAGFFIPEMKSLESSNLNKSDRLKVHDSELESTNISFELDNSLTVCNKNVLCSPQLLICVATTTAITIINIRSGEIHLTLRYEDLLKEGIVVLSNAKLVCHDPGEITVAYQPLLQKYVFTFRMNFYENDEDNLISNEKGLSLISSGPVRSKSVLRKKMRSPRQQSALQMRHMTLGFPVMQSKSIFPKRTSISKNQGFSLFESHKNSASYAAGSRSVSYSTSSNIRKRSEYSNDILNFRENQGKNLQTSLSSGLTYLRIAFSSDGKLLAAGANISPLVIFKCNPTFENKCIHKAIGMLTAIDFSFNLKYLSLATNDGSTSVINWKSGKEHLSIHFSSKFKEHIHAQFYFMDKFIIQPEDNRLTFYSYRVQEPTWLKLIAGSFPLACQKITAIGAANQLYSNLVFCGLSNKSLQIFDANVEKVAATFPQCHSKNVNCIRINEAPKGSNATSLCNFFLTSAPTIFDPIKLWDMRTEKCVTRIGDVSSNVYVSNTRPALSPCGRYIASGFEDNTLIIYDVRKINSRVTCLKGTSTVLDCSFDRNIPMLWCGSRNGDLWNFTS